MVSRFRSQSDPVNDIWDCDFDLYVFKSNKTGSVVWSGSMDDDEEGRTSSSNFRKENI
jgi:hypothetical protein